MFLKNILSYKRREVEEKKRILGLDMIKYLAEKKRGRRKLSIAIKNGRSKRGIPKIIAEIKASSPSRGIIRKGMDVSSIAKIYAEGGASAISVLVDKRFFSGSLEYIKYVKESTSLPVLGKEFIIDEYQIYDLAYNGADCILLIVRILEDEMIKEFYKKALSLGMEVLLEVHNGNEVRRAISFESPIIGINNRDLDSFDVDIKKTEELLKLIPEDRIIVSESGISRYEDICRLRDMGVDAFLIGESLMREIDIKEKLFELTGRRRQDGKG